MSKRAEELSDKIGYATFDRDEVAALIDAELRKERESLLEVMREMWPFIAEDDYGEDGNTSAFSLALKHYRAILNAERE